MKSAVYFFAFVREVRTPSKSSVECKTEIFNLGAMWNSRVVQGDRRVVLRSWRKGNM